MAKNSTDLDPEALLHLTKKELRSLLLSSKDGVLLKRLQSEYVTFIGRRIPCKDLGYRDLRDFVGDIPDVARLFVDPVGELRVAAVADRTTCRIQSLVSRQRSKKAFNRGRPFRPMDPRLLPPRMYMKPRPTVWTSRMPMSQPRYPVFGSNNMDELPTSCPDLYQKKVRVYEPRSSVADSYAYTQQSRWETSLASFSSATNIGKKAVAAAPSHEKEERKKEKEDLNLKPQVPVKREGSFVLDDEARNLSQSRSSPETDTAKELTMKEMITRLLNKYSRIFMFSGFKKKFAQEYGIKFDVANFGFSDVTEMFSALEIPAIVKRLGTDDFSIIPSLKTAAGVDKIVRKRSSASVCSVTESEKSAQTQRSMHSLRDSMPCSESLASNSSEVKTQSERPQGQFPLDDGDSVKKSVVDGLEKPISQELKNVLMHVLKSSPNGILIGDLPAAIKEQTGLDVKIEDTGYRSWNHLLLRLNDIVSMSYKGQGQLLLFDADRFTFDQNQYKVKSSFDQASQQYECYSSLPNLEAKTFMQYRGQQKSILDDSVDPNLVIQTQTVGPYQNLTVYVSNVVNPGNFWFQIDGASYDSLLSLMDSLQSMYGHPLGDQYAMPKSQMKCGRLCAAKFSEDNRWHRGTIKGFSGDMVEIYYLDYGTTSFVPSDDIRMLRLCSANLPAQAIRARLADVQPVEREWSEASGEYFLTCILERPFTASISNISQDGLVSLSLYDTTGREPVNLSNCLVAKGFAKRQKDIYETVLQGRGYRTLSSLENIDDSDSQDSENDTARSKTEIQIVIHQVKFIQLTADYCCHLVKVGQTLTINSTEVSAFLWDEDLVQTKIRQIGYNPKLPNYVLYREDHPNAFEMLAKFGVPGIRVDGKFVGCVVLYNVLNVVDILDIFGHKSCELQDALLRELKLVKSNKWIVTDDPYRREKAAGGGGGEDRSFFPNFPESRLKVDDVNNFKKADYEEKAYQLISDRKEKLLSEMCSARTREVTSDRIDVNFVSKSTLLPTTNETLVSRKKPRTNAVAPIIQPEPSSVEAESSGPSIHHPVPPGFVQPQYSFPAPASQPAVSPSMVSPVDSLIRMFSHAAIVDVAAAQASSANVPNLVTLYQFPDLQQLGRPFPAYPASLLQQQYQLHQPYLASLQRGFNSLMAHRLPYGGHPPYDSSLLGLANLSYLAQANQPTVQGEASQVGGGAQVSPVLGSDGGNPAPSSTANG